MHPKDTNRIENSVHPGQQSDLRLHYLPNLYLSVWKLRKISEPFNS